jgi:hypothetical protein
LQIAGAASPICAPRRHHEGNLWSRSLKTDFISVSNAMVDQKRCMQLWRLYHLVLRNGCGVLIAEKFIEIPELVTLLALAGYNPHEYQTDMIVHLPVPAAGFRLY